MSNNTTSGHDSNVQSAAVSSVCTFLGLIIFHMALYVSATRVFRPWTNLGPQFEMLSRGTEDDTVVFTREDNNLVQTFATIDSSEVN